MTLARLENTIEYMLRRIRRGVLGRACFALTLLGSLNGSDPDVFRAELFEGVSTSTENGWSLNGLTPAMTWTTPYLGTAALPPKLSPAGFSLQRRVPFAVRIQGNVNLPLGEYTFQLRSRMKANLYLDGNLLLASDEPKEVPLTPTQIAEKEAVDKKAREEAAQQQADREVREEAALETLADVVAGKNEKARKAVQEELDRVRLEGEPSAAKPPAAVQTKAIAVNIGEGRHSFRLEFKGRQLQREVSVVVSQGSSEARLLGADPGIAFNEKSWASWKTSEVKRISEVTEQTSRPLIVDWEQQWERKHREVAKKAGASSNKTIDMYIDEKLSSAGVTAAPRSSDYEFIRRVYLDAWGLIPSADEVRKFINDKRTDKRNRLISTLLSDDRWAAPWVSYWQDVLAENPVMFGQVPNSTGPFKNWIHRSFVEDRGYDRFATEIILMEGSDEQQGTLGFRESMSNDLPPAEKAFVVSQAFMAANMKCARCHDSPVNQYKQSDLFGIAALLEGHPVIVPATSSVGEVPGRRKPAVKVTSKPGDAIAPSFVFDASRVAPTAGAEGRETREALATWLVHDRRFAEVGVNRIWKRFFGTGLVEPVDNWPRNPKISHPELLHYLADEFESHSFSVRHIEKLILNSNVYQRVRDHALASKRSSENTPLFAAQPIRRMRAEEIVDSLHRTVGREFKSEKMAYAAVDYGFPKRTWQLVTLSNEEDNMILVRPRLQEILTTANVFGWRDQRPDPVTTRNDDPTPLQSLTLANGALMSRLVRLTDASAYTKLASSKLNFPEFCDELMLNTLSRLPSSKERQWLDKKLGASWPDRRVSAVVQTAAKEDRPREFQDMMDAYRQIAEARKEEPATSTLTEVFRKDFESVLWVLLNSPEFIFVP